MINATLMMVLLAILLIANAIILYEVNKKLRAVSKQSFPKWEYYKEGIRFLNKKNQVIIEYDKPLKK